MLGFDLALTSKYKHYEQDFIDLGRIGAGGFAHVQKVRSKIDNRQYALKIIEVKPSLCKEDIIEIIHKFLDQVKVLSHLNHKNVIQYHGCWVEGQQTDIQQILEIRQEEQPEQISEMVMVMEEDFYSGGIQFAHSEDSSGDHTNQENRNSQAYYNKQPKPQIPVDNSQASAKVRSAYKTIRIFILSQLCQGNVQAHLYQRNLAKKDAMSVKSVSNALHQGRPSKSLQQRQSKDELMENYSMILQIVEGLEYLHSKNIIHRDIKLHNIVFDRNKKCKIIDFGLAKKARMLQSISWYPYDILDHSDQLDQILSSSVGTRIYSSPQQFSLQRYDHRTDIFSLAIVILMFFCDFTTTHEELQIIEKIRKNDLQFIQCDQRLKDILSKCLGQEKTRPRLVEIRKVLKLLLRQKYQRQSMKLVQNIFPQTQNVLEKEQNIYIVVNSKLKKKLSRKDFQSLNTSLKDKQTTSSQNTVNQQQIFDFNINENDFENQA